MAATAHTLDRSSRPALGGAPRAGPLAPIAVGLVGLAVAGLVVACIRAISWPSAAAPAIEVRSKTTPSDVAGELPIVGDPIRDLTIWFSGRISDANRAGVEGLAGRFLTPLDPLEDPMSRELYGSVLLVVVPLLAIGGIVLGYLVMTARTSGEGAYAIRAITPRFVIGATLAILGIFLVSVLATFVATTDVALVEVSVGRTAVGGPAQWPASGGPFLVLQRTGYDPRLGEGPGIWNTGAWLSAGLLSGVIVTLLGMVSAMLTGIERLLIAVAPICLAAYALPATQRVTNLWLKMLAAVLAVRLVWSLLFIVFSLEATRHVDPTGAPLAADSVRAMLGTALGAAGLMLVVPVVIVPLVLFAPGPLRDER